MRSPISSRYSIRDAAGSATENRGISIYLVIGYLILVIYGSLLPFTRNDLTFDDAWTNFPHIPFLNLGVANRADLVANLLLYIPLGFLLCGFLAGRRRHQWVRIIGSMVALLFSIAIAVSIEFTQQFFAPRTVSLNDLYAEILGAVLGIVLWLVAGRRTVQLVSTIYIGGEQARHAILLIYGLAYLLLSLFPYDFLLSLDEYEGKWLSGHIGLLFAPLCGSGCMWKLIPEVLAVMPLAILLFRSLPHTPLFLAAITGAMLGILIEGLQFAIASGVSQGASIVSRAIGMMLGASLMRFISEIDWRWIRQYTRGIVLIGILPYLCLLALVNHWFSGDWYSISDAIDRLDEIRFLPFYYHYYTSEQRALISLLFQAGIYAPVGIFFWLWRWGVWSIDLVRGSTLLPGLAAGLLACIIEMGKLLVQRTHPDPTNILIAAVSAILAYRLLNMLFITKVSGGKPIANTASDNNQIENEVSATKSVAQAEAIHQIDRYATFTVQHNHSDKQCVRRPLWLTVFGLLALVIAGFAAFTHPLGATWTLLWLVSYVVLLWWRPDLWLVWVLALLPVLDLSPWSGRLFWTEFDTLLLATISVGYLRLYSGQSIWSILGLPVSMLMMLFIISALISLGFGIWPLAPLDHNAFTSYYSSYNGLRVAKGLLFSLAFMPLLVHAWSKPSCAVHKLTWGMVLGLTLEVGYVLWERATFSGLFNFQNDYRITGSFHGMHVGGAYIESYLAAALPFVVLWAWLQRKVWVTAFAIVLYGLGAYSIMVTFSRGGQIAFAVVTLIVLLGFMWLSLRGRTQRLVNISAISLLTIAALAVAWPIAQGGYSQSRWAAFERDMIKRTDHWQEAIRIFQLRDAALFGVGLGTFPSAYYWGAEVASRFTTYRFITENNNTILRLGSGDLTYLEQSVNVRPGQKYTLTIDLLSQSDNAALTMTVCEKSLLHSYTCVTKPLRISEPGGEWTQYKLQIDTKDFLSSWMPFQRPVKLSLFNDRHGTLVDIDNVALYDEIGRNLIQNGHFSNGMHHWFFSTNHHLPWHIENLYLSILFEQGWIGLICFTILIIYTLIRCLFNARQRDSFSITLFASFIALLMLGILNSWNDEPRLTFLFYFLLITGLIADQRSLSTQYQMTSLQKQT